MKPGDVVKLITILAWSLASLSLASCGNDDEPSIDDLEDILSGSDSNSYKTQTQDFLNDNVQVEDQVGGDVSQASCDEPSSSTVGTQYQCSASVEGEGQATFDVEIDDVDSFLVVGVEFAD